MEPSVTHLLTLAFPTATIIIHSLNDGSERKFRITTLNVHGLPIDIVETPECYYISSTDLDLSEMEQEHREIK